MEEREGKENEKNNEVIFKKKKKKTLAWLQLCLLIMWLRHWGKGAGRQSYFWVFEMGKNIKWRRERGKKMKKIMRRNNFLRK